MVVCHRVTNGPQRQEGNSSSIFGDDWRQSVTNRVQLLLEFVEQNPSLRFYVLYPTLDWGSLIKQIVS